MASKTVSVVLFCTLSLFLSFMLCKVSATPNEDEIMIALEAGYGAGYGLNQNGYGAYGQRGYGGRGGYDHGYGGYYGGSSSYGGYRSNGGYGGYGAFRG